MDDDPDGPPRRDLTAELLEICRIYIHTCGRINYTGGPVTVQ